MRASLRLEAIGDDAHAAGRIAGKRLEALGCAQVAPLLSWPARQWCAELTGLDARYGFARRFLPGKKDYARGNGRGSRGVHVYYTLESGHLYEVCAPVSWKHDDRYCCTVTEDGTIVRMTREETQAWLRRRTSDRSG